MENLKERLLPEIEEFRKVGHKFVNGEMSVMDFMHQVEWEHMLIVVVKSLC